MQTTQVPEVFTCSQCHQTKPIPTGTGGTGYGSARDSDAKTCYACCALEDVKYMKAHGHIDLYLTSTKTSEVMEVTNWPGTLRFPVWQLRRGRHNIARVQYTVYFYDGENVLWTGRQYGDMTQIVRCKRLAKQPK